MVSGSKRDRNGEKPLVDVKRVRTSLDQDEYKPNASGAVRLVPYERLKNVPLPDKISALSHVLNFLDILLMTPGEALSVAIEINDLEWVQQMLDKFPCDYTDAMEQAAGLNRLDVVNLITTSMSIGNRFVNNPCKIRVLMEKGALSAARNGHVAVLERLLPFIIKTDNNSQDWYREVQKIFNEGAVHGQLEVVKFMTENESTKRMCSKFPLEDTLPEAMMAGHFHVAAFLLDLGGIIWNLAKAFVVALDKGQKLLAERIQELYGQPDLFVDLGLEGDVNAMEYIYEDGCKDSELVRLALANAASEAHIEVVKFLLESGRVTSEAFEEAFIEACFGHKPQSINTVMLLYKLDQNERISDHAITAAFESAARFCNEEHPAIILFLYKQQCIPSNLIGKALLCAVKSLHEEHLNDGAKSTKVQVVKCLHDDERLTPNTLGEAFLYAVKYNKTNVALLLYDEQRTPPEFLVKAFVEATHYSNTGLVKEILKFLTVEEHVPRKFMHETFVAAARRGQMWALERVCKSLTADLPLEVLKNGLDAAGYDRIEKFILKMMRDQVSKDMHKNHFFKNR
ncbi:hypothetical protein DVH05_000977 [Phytophthora capsici]|nr:hypothetical protein DVH05_000977 [Phytophthora capsici]